jgi:hypothetical protein
MVLFGSSWGGLAWRWCPLLLRSGRLSVTLPASRTTHDSLLRADLPSDRQPKIISIEIILTEMISIAMKLWFQRLTSCCGGV